MSSVKNQWHDIECYLLSCMIRDGECLEHGLDKLSPEMFSVASHREIFRAIDELAGVDADNAMIERLLAYFVGRDDVLETIDQIDWSSTTSTVNFQPMCERLIGRWERREAYRLLQAAQQKIVDDAADPVEVLTSVMDQLATTTGGEDTYMDLHTLLRTALEDAEQRLNAQTPPYLDLGLPSLSPVVGLERGHLMIVAGASGEGKTTFGINVAVHMAIHGSRALYINGEMPRAQIARRVAAILADVSNRALRQGAQNPDAAQNVARLRKRAQEILDNNDLRDRLYVSDAMELTAGRIVRDIRRFARRHHIDVAIVDYIQRIPTAFDDRAYQGLIQVVEQLKTLAVELGVAIIVLAQLNHDSDITRRDLAAARGMKRPADAVLNIIKVDDAAHIVGDEQLLETLEQAGTTHIVYTSKLRDDVDNLWVPLKFYSQSRRMAEVAIPVDDVIDQLPAF